MALFIELTAPDGAVSRIAANGPNTVLDTQPGYRYQIVSDAAGAPTAVAEVRRTGQSLMIDLEDSPSSIELSGFFLERNADASVVLSRPDDSANETITPQSEPIAALTSGGFLLWAASDSDAIAPADPAAETNWRPIAAVAGGLVLIGGAAAGGGSNAVASDRTPPGAPGLNAELNSNSTRPVIEGTAEAGSSIRLTIDIGDSGQRVTYTTVADNNGQWAVNLDTQTPFSGVLPPEGLPTAVASTARVIAVDPAGNAGPVTIGLITIDVIAPTTTARIDTVSSDAPAPVDENNNSTSAPGINIVPGKLIDGGQTNDGTPTLAGSISSPLETGERVLIWRDDNIAGEATVNGMEWTFTDSGFAPGTYTYTARVTDRAGNAAPADNSFTVSVDALAPDPASIGIVSDDDIINFNDAQQPILIGGSAEAGTRVLVGFGAVVQQATVGSDGNWQVAFNDTQLPGNGNHLVSVTVLDDFGNRSAATTRPVNVVTGLPSAPVFDTSADSILGGPVPAINAAEAGDVIVISGNADPGNTLRVTLTPDNGGQPVSVLLTVGASGVFNAEFARATLPDGTYSAQAVATDAVDNVTSGPALSILIDTSAPTGFARITGVIDNEGEFSTVGNNGVINDTSPTLVGDASGLGGGEFIQVFRNGQSIGNAQVNGTNWQLTDNSLTDGTYTYNVIVTDRAGNTGPVGGGETIVVTVDTTPPPPPFVNTVAGDNIVTGAEASAGIVITGGAQANTQVIVDWAGQVQSTTSNGNGDWSVRFDSVPADGLTQVTARIADAAGNQASAFQQVRVDTNPPAAPRIDTVEGDNRINASEAADGIQITGQAEGNATINLLWDGAAQTVAATGSGFWAATFAGVPAQGVTTLTVSATDAGANTGPASSTQIFVDTLAPTIPVINPVESDNTITFDEAADGIQITGQGEPDSQIQVSWASANRQTTVDGAGNWVVSFDNAPAQGVSSITASASDAAGNQSASASVQVTVNTVPPPPTPGINAVTGDGVINLAEAGAGVTLSGSAQAGAQVLITWGAFQATTQADGGGNWSLPVATGQIPQTTATITAIARNAAGDSQPAQRAVTVDLDPPASPNIAVVEGDDTITLAEAGDGVPVSGTAEAGSSVEVSWGNLSQTVSASNAGQWSTGFAAVPPSNASTISAVARDAAGNTSAAGTRTVVIDDTQPAPVQPTINVIEGNDQINAAEAANGVQISGTAEAGATVTVQWGGNTRTGVANPAGAYNVSFSVQQVPDADAVVSVVASNAGGDSPAATRSVAIDVTAPAEPTIATVEGNDIITGAEASDGVPVTGTAEAGATVTITWGDLPDASTIATGGTWQIDFSTIPQDGSSTISAVATDSAGNSSAAATRTVTVSAEPPTQSVTIADVLDNVGTDRGSVANGGTTDDDRPRITINLSDPLGTGERLEVFINDDLGRRYNNGEEFNYTPASLNDGQYTFTAHVIDSSGNTGALSDPYQITIATTP